MNVTLLPTEIKELVSEYTDASFRVKGAILRIFTDKKSFVQFAVKPGPWVAQLTPISIFTHEVRENRRYNWYQYNRVLLLYHHEADISALPVIKSLPENVDQRKLNEYDKLKKLQPHKENKEIDEEVDRRFSGFYEPIDHILICSDLAPLYNISLGQKTDIDPIIYANSEVIALPLIFSGNPPQP